MRRFLCWRVSYRRLFSRTAAVAVVALLWGAVAQQPLAARAATASPSPAAATGSPGSSPGSTPTSSSTSSSSGSGQSAQQLPTQANGQPRPDAKDSHFDPNRSKELATQDPSTQLWANPDGTETLRLGASALKGLDENGTPGNTDLTLVTGKNGSLRPHRTQAQVSFAPTSASQMATLDLAPGKQAQVSFDNVTPGVVPSRVGYELGQAAHYQGVLPQGTSLEMRPLTDGLETVYMVQSAAAGTGLTEHLRLPAGYTLQQGTGEIDVLDATGTQVAVWGGGFATDVGTSEREGDVTLQLQSVQGGVATAQVLVDPAWLNDPQRVFPVRIDPTLRLYSSTYGSGSTFIENGRGTGEWYADPIRVGTYDSGANVNRALITYPLYQIPAHFADHRCHALGL